MDGDELDFFDGDEWSGFSSNSSFIIDPGVFADQSGLTVQVIVYSILFAIGVPGNILVLITFSRCHGDTPFNMSSNSLIISLAAADLGILLMYVPFYVTYEVLDLIWPFGSTMCKIVFSSTHIFVYASLGTLVVLAIERYFVTFHLHVSTRKFIIGMLFSWIVALILSIPQMINLQLVSLDDEQSQSGARQYMCELVWPDPIYERVLHPIDFILLYVLPLAVIAVLYVRIAFMLRSAIRQNVPNHRLARQVRKVVYVLLVVVVVFGICNLPIHALHLYRVFWYDRWLKVVEESPWVFSFSVALYLIPHAANPIIYAIMDRKFRSISLKVLRRCKSAGRSTPSSCKHLRMSCLKVRREEESAERSLKLQSLN